jgi:Zn finger protein HypA/HybF involved in hydrogenase expression
VSAERRRPSEAVCERPVVRCPACDEMIAVHSRSEMLHRLLRCPTCGRRLQIVEVAPLRVEPFRTYGLALVDD